MSSNWDKIKKTVKDELHDAAATGNKYLKIGKGKLDMVSMNNALNNTFKEMGVEVYGQITKGIKGDIRQNPKVKRLIEKADQLKKSIKDEELEIKRIKK